MVRRLQLMEPERRSIGTRIADAVSGLRDGLLRDNKVLPPVLAALALVIFAWLLAGAIVGDPGEEERVARQAAQPSVAQSPDDGSSETPAPGVENRDNESLDVFESKDPFRELIPQADAGGGDTTGDATSGTPDDGTDSATDDGTGSATDDGTGGGSGSDGTGPDSGGSDGTGPGSDDTGSGGTGSSDGTGSDDSGSGTGSGSGAEDFLDQTSPGDPGFDDGGGSGSGGSGNGSGSGSSGGGSGQYEDGDGNGSLFDSGGSRRR